MKHFGKILFFLLAPFFVCMLIVPDDFIMEVEELVELSDDLETEEDTEEEKDEFEWQWQIELSESISQKFDLNNYDLSKARYMGEPSDGERVIFSPPPENVI
jgi:hypothetical protein